MINYSTAPLINWPQRFAKRQPSSLCVPMFVCSRVLLTRRLIGISRCRRLVHTERDACFGWQKAQHARVRFRPFFLTLVVFFCLCYDHFCEYLWKELEWRDRGTACRHCFSLFCYSVLTDFAKNRKQFVDVFGQICNHSQYQSTLRHCSVCLCPLWFAIQHLFFLPECVPYPYHATAVALFPIILCLHLTHQTVAVPAARAPAQITTRQLIELFFSSQAGGHCKNIPTLEYGFLVQVRHQWHMRVITTAPTHPRPARTPSAVRNVTNRCVCSQRELGFIAIFPS